MEGEAIYIRIFTNMSCTAPYSRPLSLDVIVDLEISASPRMVVGHGQGFRTIF